MKIYQLLPLFREKIWGGHQLRDNYGFNVGDKLIGEAWIASSLPGEEDNIVSGMNMTLSQLYEKHNEMFGTHTTQVIPIKMMLANCTAVTSLQVHPGDAYAKKHEASLGKPECVCYLQAAPDAFSIYGNLAVDMAELKSLIEHGEWQKLLRYEKVKENDFAYIPAGRLHATGAGTLLLEISRNADLTYRLYDFDRVDKNGNKRDMQIDHCMEIIRVPDHETAIIQPRVENKCGAQILTYHDVPGEFSIYQIKIQIQAIYEQKEFGFMFIKEGNGYIGKQRVIKGQTWFLPCNNGSMNIQGSLDIIIGSYKEIKIK
jgi:mannose-6-phosphate isomerase